MERNIVFHDVPSDERHDSGLSLLGAVIASPAIACVGCGVCFLCLHKAKVRRTGNPKMPGRGNWDARLEQCLISPTTGTGTCYAAALAHAETTAAWKGGE